MKKLLGILAGVVVLGGVIIFGVQASSENSEVKSLSETLTNGANGVTKGISTVGASLKLN